jgi:hypothetical protein
MAKPAAMHPISVRFGREERSMLQILRARAAASKRTLSEQMKYYAHLGIVASDNPDLPLSFIEGLLEGAEESRAGLSVPYKWGVLK